MRHPVSSITNASFVDNLVNPSLRNIPHTGYISPEAIVPLVSAPPKLEILHIDFIVLPSLPDIIFSPPLTRSVLPALRNFSFFGGYKYLEDFVSRIHTPQLNSLVICYSWGCENDFDVSQLSNFIDRSESLKRSLSRHFKIMFHEDKDIVTFCIGRTTSDRWDPIPGISVYFGRGIDRQFPHFTTVVGRFFPILSDVVHCIIDSVRVISESTSLSEQENDFDWLQLLRRLPSLQTLFVFHNTAGLISQALAYVDVGMITEFLPALQLLCSEEQEKAEDQTTSSIHRFLAAHQDSGHPVTFVKTKEEFEEILKSYP